MLHRSLAVAPPRVSINPAPRGRPGPPVPAVAAKPSGQSGQSGQSAQRTTSTPAQSSAQAVATGSGPPSALYSAAAALFRSAGATEHPVIDARGQDQPMSDESAIVRRSPAAAPAVPMTEFDARTIRPPMMVNPVANSRELDELVDIVVARIEQRVVDELERRGRRGAGGI
jgi:hypothetical protein